MNDFDRGFSEELEKIAFSWSDPIAGAGMGALGGAALGGVSGAMGAGPLGALIGAGVGGAGGAVIGGAAGGLGSMMGLGKRKPKPKPEDRSITVKMQGPKKPLMVPNLAPPKMSNPTLTGTLT